MSVHDDDLLEPGPAHASGGTQLRVDDTGAAMDGRPDAPFSTDGTGAAVPADGAQRTLPDGDDGPVRALTGLLERAAERERTFLDRLAADQELIGRMQGAIESLQADQVKSLLGPVVTELANLHAGLLEASGRDLERLGAERIRKELVLLSERVEDAVDAVGAETLGACEGDVFDARKHAAVRRVPTDDPALHGTVDHVVRQGFTFDANRKPLLHARVVVRFHTPDAVPTGTDDLAAAEQAPSAGFDGTAVAPTHEAENS